MTSKKLSSSYIEFVIIVSMMMALNALAIDAMLPALGQISEELVIVNPNGRQWVISVIFLGMSIGQLFFGPLSDSLGRKKSIYIGYGVFMIGSLISATSTNFSVLLFGRALQGLGVSAPRAVSLAMVRDMFEGRKMARVMSFAMAVFILVPVIAPMLGQGVMSFAGWRSIFVCFILFALITLVWFAIRIPETLAPEKRIPFTLKRIANSIQEIVKIRSALGYTLTAGLLYGVFIGYLNSSQQIFQEQYMLGDLFPLYFGVIALSMGLASFLNARLVMKYGMSKLVRWMLRVVFVLALIFLGISSLLAGHPPLWGLMIYLMASFFCIGLLFGNVNSLAMQPVGHMAGIGSAMVGSISTLVSMLLGTLIGHSYKGTIMPLVLGMTILTGISIFIAWWAEKE